MNVRVHRQFNGALEHGAVISAGGMALQKRLFPLVSVLTLVGAGVVLSRTWPDNMILVATVLLFIIVGDVLIGLRLLRQVDEVIDAADHLIVRKSDQEVRIPLSDVNRVSPTFWGVTLHVSESVPFGPTISFSPQAALGRGAVVMSLRSRLQAVKRPN